MLSAVKKQKILPERLWFAESLISYSVGADQAEELNSGFNGVAKLLR